jgi:hypothetical protein
MTAGNGLDGDRPLMPASLGPFFAVEVHDPGSAPGAGWRPWSDLIERPDVLRARVEAARVILAAGGGTSVEAVPVAVAAFVVHLGLAARLVSPFLALAALHGIAEVPAVADIRWRDAVGGAFPLSLPAAVLERRPDVVPDWPRWADLLAGQPLEELSRAVAELTPSRHTRSGNTASAVHGALTVLTGPGLDGIDARTAARARNLGWLLLDRTGLRSAATGDPGTPGFRRRNCCLIYRVAGTTGSASAAAVCGDCVLAPPRPARSNS